jgi:hypothetical protein
MSEDEMLNEIRERHEHKVRWLREISALGPQSHEDRAFLLTEIERLRARVEVLESALRIIARLDSPHVHMTPMRRACAALGIQP